MYHFSASAMTGTALSSSRHTSSRWLTCVTLPLSVLAVRSIPKASETVVGAFFAGAFLVGAFLVVPSWRACSTALGKRRRSACA